MFILLKSCVLNHISLNFLYGFLSARIWNTWTESGCHRMWVNKVLIHKQVYVKNTHELQKQSVMSVKVNSWEINHIIILDLCGSNIQ